MRISDWSSDVCSSDLPDALRAREQLLPELGQGDAARLALEQRQAEQILERADRAADSRLGQVQFGGRLADAAEARGNDEMVEMLHFHAAAAFTDDLT